MAFGRPARQEIRTPAAPLQIAGGVEQRRGGVPPAVDLFELPGEGIQGGLALEARQEVIAHQVHRAVEELSTPGIVAAGPLGESPTTVVVPPADEEGALRSPKLQELEPREAHRRIERRRQPPSPDLFRGFSHPETEYSGSPPADLSKQNQENSS